MPTELSCGKVNNAEERRVRWTTYFNIKSWFDNWESDLVKLGFAFVDDNHKVIIPDAQLMRILNIDETCLVMDGNKCNRGGRPEVTFYSRNLPNLGRSTLSITVMPNVNTEITPPNPDEQTTSDQCEEEAEREFALAFV